MIPELWKATRWALFVYPPALALLIVFHEGLAPISCGALVIAGVWLVASPIWMSLLRKGFELPAARREARDEAMHGQCCVLFLRPFQIDRHWGALEEFLLTVVREHNTRYATHKNVIALGIEDSGAIAKLDTPDDSWRTLLVELADRAEAIFILPIHSAARRTSGIVEELVHVMDALSDKAIFVMPPQAVWDRDLEGTIFAGELERFWVETEAILGERAPSLLFPKYEPQGCFWTLDQNPGGWYTTKYTYSAAGAATVLFKVLDYARLKREEFIMKYDPGGWATAQAQKSNGGPATFLL